MAEGGLVATPSLTNIKNTAGKQNKTKSNARTTGIDEATVHIHVHFYDFRIGRASGLIRYKLCAHVGQ